MGYVADTVSTELEELDWREALHPRDRRGRFARAFRRFQAASARAGRASAVNFRSERGGMESFASDFQSLRRSEARDRMMREFKNARLRDFQMMQDTELSSLYGEVKGSIGKGEGSDVAWADLVDVMKDRGLLPGRGPTNDEIRAMSNEELWAEMDKLRDEGMEDPGVVIDNRAYERMRREALRRRRGKVLN